MEKKWYALLIALFILVLCVPFVFASTLDRIESPNSTSLNYSFDYVINNDSTYFSFPNGSRVASATMNISGFNDTEYFPKQAEWWPSEVIGQTGTTLPYGIWVNDSYVYLYVLADMDGGVVPNDGVIMRYLHNSTFVDYVNLTQAPNGRGLHCNGSYFFVSEGIQASNYGNLSVYLLNGTFIVTKHLAEIGLSPIYAMGGNSTHIWLFNSSKIAIEYDLSDLTVTGNIVDLNNTNILPTYLGFDSISNNYLYVINYSGGRYYNNDTIEKYDLLGNKVSSSLGVNYVSGQDANGRSRIRWGYISQMTVGNGSLWTWGESFGSCSSVGGTPCSYWVNELSMPADETYPSSVEIDISDDGDLEFNHSTELNSTHSPNTTVDFTNELNEYINTTCATDPCNITINITSGSAGIVQLDDINIIYSANNPIINSNATVDPDPQYTNTTYITANVTDEEGDLNAVNFTITGPNSSVYISNVNGTSAGDIWNSSTFVIDQYGSNWTVNITAEDIAGLIDSEEWTFSVVLGTLTIHEPVDAYKTYAKMAGGEELFNITLSHNGTSYNTVNFTLEGDIAVASNFTVTFANNPINVSVGTTNYTLVNITSNSSLATGTYYGNITVNRTNDGDVQKITVITITIDANVGEIDLSPLSHSGTKYDNAILIWELTMNNTGNYQLSDCNLSASSDLISFTSFDKENGFSLDPSNTTTIRVTYSAEAPIDTHTGNILVKCEATPTGGIDELYVYPVSLTVTTGSASGGGGTSVQTILSELTRVKEAPIWIWYFPFKNITQKLTVGPIESSAVLVECKVNRTEPPFTCTILDNYNVEASTYIDDDSTLFKLFEGEITIIGEHNQKKAIPISIRTFNVGYYWEINDDSIMANILPRSNPYIYKFEGGKVLGIRVFSFLLPIIFILLSILLGLAYGVTKR